MLDITSINPEVVLGVAIIIALLLGNKPLKLGAALMFFLYPVLLGRVHFDFTVVYIGDVFKFWIVEVLQTLLEYVRQLPIVQSKYECFLKPL